jgi:sulfoxide reductase heme-binding subunit YedZ
MMATTSSQALWYATRATGIVALVLLTASVVLGALTTLRVGTAAWPRFTLQDLHRRVSLLALVFVGLHVITTVSDSFAPIGWVSVVVPFTSAYRRLWLGLGSVSFDLLLAVTISSLLRRHVAPRTWRALHWLAYASWPLAVVHGLGTGTDPHLGWMLFLVVACVVAVVAAVGWRIVAWWPARAGARVLAGVTTVVALVALAAWTASGPLRPGWAARAGTPRALLVGSHRLVVGPKPGTPTTSTSTTAPAVSGAALPAPPYRSPLVGTISQGLVSGGVVRVDMAARTTGSLDAVLDVVIVGAPDGSGGVAMQQSQVTFGSPGAPSQFAGRVSALDGTRVELTLADQTGHSLDLRLSLSIAGSRLSGELASVGAGAGRPGGPQ